MVPTSATAADDGGRADALRLSGNSGNIPPRTSANSGASSTSPAVAGIRTNLGTPLRSSIAQEHGQQSQEEASPNKALERHHGQDHPESHGRATTEARLRPRRSQGGEPAPVRTATESNPAAPRAAATPRSRKTPTGQGVRPMPALWRAPAPAIDSVSDLSRTTPGGPAAVVGGTEGG